MIQADTFLYKLYRDNFEDWTHLNGDHTIGVEIADFTKADVWADSSLYESRVSFYKETLKDLNIVKTFHGPFWGIDVQCLDQDIQEISRQKVQRSINTAQELHCKRIVFHTGYIPMVTEPGLVSLFKDAAIEFWHALSEENSIEICLENTWELDTDYLQSIIKNVNHKRLNVCMDSGHIYAFSKISAEQWFSTFAEKITHLHWHDNNLKHDEHLSLGKGKIDWQDMAGLRQKYCPASDIVLELKSAQDYQESLGYLRSRGII